MPTASSSVFIANLALGHLGVGSRIESFNDNTPEARAMKLWFDPCRKEVLTRFDWSFARKRLALAEHSEDPPEGVWDFRYQYPSDCIEFRRLRNPSGEQADPVPFQEETASDGSRSIITNLEQATGLYTFDCTNVSNFSAGFVMALSHNLAWRTAFTITKKQSITDKQGQIYEGLFRRGASQNANAQASEAPRGAVWVRGR